MVFRIFIFVSLLLTSCQIIKNPLERYKERPYGKTSYNGPIIDVHAHPKSPYSDHFKKAKKSEVSITIIMGTPNNYRKFSSREFIEVANRLNYVKAMCSSDFVGLAARKDFLGAQYDLEQAIKDFDKGRCIGFGEVGLSHYNKPKKSPDRGEYQHELQLRLDHQLVGQLLTSANERSAPVIFHIEPYYSPEKINRLDEIMAFYKENCKKYPFAKIIAAHNGMMAPSNLQSLFKICDNFYTDIKFTHAYGMYWGFSDLHTPSDLEFRIHERWAKSIEAFPDRYMFGSDWKYGPDRMKKWHMSDFVGHIGLVRRIVGSLKSEVQEKFMFKNAAEIFNINIEQ